MSRLKKPGYVWTMSKLIKEVFLKKKKLRATIENRTEYFVRIARTYQRCKMSRYVTETSAVFERCRATSHNINPHNVKVFSRKITPSSAASRSRPSPPSKEKKRGCGPPGHIQSTPGNT